MSKLLAKLKNKHFLSLAGNGFVSLFGLLTFSLMYKALPIADAGQWVFLLSVVGICDAVRSGFLGTATIRFYAGTEARRGREVLGAVWILAIAITIGVLMLDTGAYFLVPAGNTDMAIIIKWAGLTFLSSLPFNVIYWKLQAEENYFALLWLKLLNSAATLAIFATLAIMRKMTLESALLYNVITNCVTSLVGIVFGFGKIKSVFNASKKCLSEIAHYGKFSLATTFSSSLLGNVDNLIINFLLGPAALAIYSIPMKLMQIIEIPLQSFVGTGMSGMAVAFNQNNLHHVTHILKKYAGMLTMAFIPLSVLALLFANQAVFAITLGSHKYTGTSAADIYRCYMVFCLLYPVDRFNGTTLDMIHRPKVNFYKVLIMLAVNIVGDFAGVAVLHNLYGIVAAAVLTHLAGVIYGYYRLGKYLPVSVWSIFSTGYIEMKLFISKQLGRSAKE